MTTGPKPESSTFHGPEPWAAPEGAVTAPPSPSRRRAALALRVAGIALALGAIAFLVATLVEEWPEVSVAVADANAGLLGLAWLLSLSAMWGLAALWLWTMRAFGSRPRPSEVSAWYFAGEMGKYLPGGIWPVVGRGELASRAGISRSVAYGSTMLSLGLMVLGGLLLCAGLLPFSIGGDEPPGAVYLLFVVLPIGLLVLHPAVLGRLFRLGGRLSRGRVDLPVVPWARMLGLVAAAVPSWLLVGLASWVVAQSLGYEVDPLRAIFAATLAWVAGFLAIPVPAGAGIREIVFVAACGLGTTEATVVATLSRFLFILVDAIGGLLGLAYVRAMRVLTNEST